MKSIIFITLLSLFSLTSCKQRVAEPNTHQVYFSKTVSMEKVLSKELRILRIYDDLGGGGIWRITQQSFLMGYSKWDDGHLSALHCRPLMISSEGFEVYFISEERAAGEEKTSIRTTTVFFPFDKVTEVRIFDKYDIRGYFSEIEPEDDYSLKMLSRYIFSW